MTSNRNLNNVSFEYKGFRSKSNEQNFKIDPVFFGFLVMNLKVLNSSSNYVSH